MNQEQNNLNSNNFNVQDYNGMSNVQTLNNQQFVNQQMINTQVQQVNTQTVNNQSITTQQVEINPNIDQYNQNNNKIIGYNPQTGQPIYEIQKFNKKKTIKPWIIVLIGITILILAALLIFLPKNKNKELTRTFMIYMVGSDLESKSGMATFELEGLDPTVIDMENINVVLIAGGSTRWNNNYINEEETSIYELTDSGFKKVKQQPIKNMGSFDTLSEFLKYSFDNYKTDEYSLIFWNHGGAIEGSEYDELNFNDNLSLTEISMALKQSPFNKNNKMEVVIFGTCLNGSLEMGNTFKDYAKYFVASEEISWSFSNTSDLAFIGKIETTDRGSDVGVKFIEEYKGKMDNAKWNYGMSGLDYSIYSTYSLVDLNNLDDLNKSLDDFFKDIDLTSNYNTIAKVRSNLYQYGYNQAGIPLYDMVDLYNLVYNLKDLSPNTANRALETIEDTVLYNYATNSLSRGISIYFPYNALESQQDNFLYSYKDINPINSYNKFIEQFKKLKSSNSTQRLSFNENVSRVDKSEKDADFELDLTNEQLNAFAKAEFIVFRDNKDGYYLPVYRGREVELLNNKLFAKIKDRQLKIGDEEYQRIITLIEEDSTDSYIKYSTYGVLQDLSSNEIYEWKDDNVKISIVYDKKTNEIQITDALLMSENNLPSKISVDPKKYTNLELGSSSYKIFDENNEFNENWSETSNGIFEGIDVDPAGDYKIELEDYSDGYDYYCTFIIYDVNNNYYYSPLIKMN